MRWKRSGDDEMNFKTICSRCKKLDILFRMKDDKEYCIFCCNIIEGYHNKELFV